MFEQIIFIGQLEVNEAKEHQIPLLLKAVKRLALAESPAWDSAQN